MPQTIWHQFSAQFLMLFQLVCSVLLSELPLEAIVQGIAFQKFTANQHLPVQHSKYGALHKK